MNKNDQDFLVQKIRTQYTEKEHTQLDELMALDSTVRRPAVIFAYVFGVLGAMIMGVGMSLVMTELGETLGLSSSLPIGVVIGVVGLLMVLVNYPIYKRILSSRRRQYADRIIAVSDKIMKGCVEA